MPASPCHGAAAGLACSHAPSSSLGSFPAELLGQEVQLAPDCIGEEVSKMKAALQDGQVLLLENVRWVAPPANRPLHPP